MQVRTRRAPTTPMATRPMMSKVVIEGRRGLGLLEERIAAQCGEPIERSRVSQYKSTDLETIRGVVTTVGITERCVGPMWQRFGRPNAAKSDVVRPDGTLPRVLNLGNHHQLQGVVDPV